METRDYRGRPQRRHGCLSRLWFPFVPVHSYNHEPQRDFEIAHLRRISRTLEVPVSRWVQIVRLIQSEDPDALITRTDVRNIRHHLAASLRAGRSANEAAVEIPKDNCDLFKAWRNELVSLPPRPER